MRSHRWSENVVLMNGIHSEIDMLFLLVSFLK